MALRLGPLLLLLILLGCHGTPSPDALLPPGTSCRITEAQRSEARALNWQEFDQTGTALGSYRVLAESGCPQEALAAYEDWVSHGPGYPDARARGIGNFHHAQLLEITGSHAKAMELFSQSFREESEEDPRAVVWNIYVRGVMGFFAQDSATIRHAQDLLTTFDDAFAHRQVGILNGLLVCIGQPYQKAMSSDCQGKSPPS